MKTLRIPSILLCLALVCVFVLSPAHGQSFKKKRVLFLNSFHQGVGWSDTITNGVQRTLQSAASDIYLHIEYLDAEDAGSPEQFAALAEFYKHKFSSEDLDLVISADDPAFEFMLRYRQEVFRDVPWVFCGVNYLDPAALTDQTLVTGVVEAFDLYRTLGLLLKLHADTTEVVVINDRTRTGLANKRIFTEKVLPYFRRRVTFRLIEDLSMADVQKEVFKLSQGTVLLLLTFNRDGAGNVFSNEEAIDLVSQYADVPIYSVWEYYLGRGIVGGMLTSGYVQGETAARLAVRILEGEDPANIAVIRRSPNRYMFDYEQLQRYAIKDVQLPPESVVVKTPAKFLEVPKSTVWANVALTVLLTAAVLILLVNIYMRKRAERDRLQLETQMQQAQKLESLGVMAGGIAHDFNNLLMGILGNASLAVMELPQDSVAHKGIEEIQKAARRAAKLTNQLLAYSGRSKLVTQSTDLSKLTTEMAPLSRRAISKRADLNLELVEDLPLIDGDPAQMRQVIMNLITNASEAIDDADCENGEIRVVTGTTYIDSPGAFPQHFGYVVHQGLYVYLEVHDNGCGMEVAIQNRIFDPFYTTKFTGRGLGLAAVLGIVRGHKGVIQIDSKVGRGTTIRVMFPEARYYEAVQPTENEPPAAGALQWQGKGTVLVIDDEEGVREVCVRILRKFGFTTLTAQDGYEGLRLVQEREDELVSIILDLTMPRLDGIRALKEIRAINMTIPVILSSGYTEQDATQRFAEKGFQGFIQKPYAPMALIDEIRKHLGQD